MVGGVIISASVSELPMAGQLHGESWSRAQSTGKDGAGQAGLGHRAHKQ